MKTQSADGRGPVQQGISRSFSGVHDEAVSFRLAWTDSEVERFDFTETLNS